jgi:hypothetical protein
MTFHFGSSCQQNSVKWKVKYIFQMSFDILVTVIQKVYSQIVIWVVLFEMTFHFWFVMPTAFCRTKGEVHISNVIWHISHCYTESVLSNCRLSCPVWNVGLRLSAKNRLSSKLPSSSEFVFMKLNFRLNFKVFFGSFKLSLQEYVDVGESSSVELT